MSPPAAHAGHVELADVVRAHAGDLDGLTPAQRVVLRAIATCRTAALGGHRRQCDHCGHQEISYHSGRDRHCPKCQGLDEVRWVEGQRRDLLPVQYFHVIFTVPDALHPLFLTTPAIASRLLFAAVAKTLEEVALRRLRATIGFTAVLHTWTQQLLYHPHIHGMVPGGGLAPGGTRWIPARRDFFLPVRVLSEVFRGKRLATLETALDNGTLRARPGEDPRGLLTRSACTPWVVYGKPPFAGAEQVLAYLGRYAHRIAISNDRLVSLQAGEVSFRWKDRAHGHVARVATLDAKAFLRRFLLHVLPSRFIRIRHDGFLANAVRRETLATVRTRLGQPVAAPESAAPPQARTLGSAAAAAHRERCHAVSAVWRRPLPDSRRAAGGVGWPGAEPMTPQTPVSRLSCPWPGCRPRPHGVVFASPSPAVGRPASRSAPVRALGTTLAGHGSGVVACVVARSSSTGLDQSP